MCLCLPQQAMGTVSMCVCVLYGRMHLRVCTCEWVRKSKLRFRLPAISTDALIARGPKWEKPFLRGQRNISHSGSITNLWYFSHCGDSGPFSACCFFFFFFNVPSVCVAHFQLLVSQNDFWKPGAETSPHLLHPAGFQFEANTEITPGDIKGFESVCSRGKCTIHCSSSLVAILLNDYSAGIELSGQKQSKWEVTG